MNPLNHLPPLSDLERNRLNTGPNLPAGIEHNYLASLVIGLLTIYNELDMSGDQRVSTTELKPIIGNCIHALSRAYNVPHILNVIGQDYQADLMIFLDSYKPNTTGRRLNSADSELQVAYCLLNPYGKELTELLKDTSSAGNMQTKTSIANLRSVRRKDVISVRYSNLVPVGKRDGKGKAQPINKEGKMLYDSRDGLYMVTNTELVISSPLYLFHARAWGRHLWALEVYLQGLDRCPYNNITVAQLQQGTIINDNELPSRTNGGWWYLVEAEDYVERMSTTVVLPYYTPNYEYGKPTNTVDERYSALTSVVLRKVGLDGHFGGERDYRSSHRSGAQEATTIATLKRIIHDEKRYLGFNAEESIRQQMRVIPDYAVDIEEQVNVDSARLNVTSQTIADELTQLLDNTSYGPAVTQAPEHQDAQQQLTALIRHELDTVMKENVATNIVPFAETPQSEAAARIALLKQRIIEAQRLEAEFNRDNPN